MKTHIDYNNIIRTVILFFLLTILYMKSKFGLLNLYLHPKMFIFVHFSVSLLGLMLLYTVFHLFTDTKTKTPKLLQYALFIFLIILLLVNPNTDFQKNTALLKGVQLNDESNKTNKIFTNNNKNQPDIKKTSNQKETGQKEPDQPPDRTTNKEEIKTDKNQNTITKKNIQKQEPVQKPLILTEKNHLMMLQQIFKNPQEYENKKLTIRGFVFFPKNISSDYFIISRLAIICCAADAKIIGLLVKNQNKKVSFEEKQWLKMTGTIKIEDVLIDDAPMQLPVIHIDHHEKIKTPSSPYVFYNYN